MSGNSAASLPGSSQAVSMPVSPAPITTAVAAAGVLRPAGQRRQVPVQRHRAVVGVDVESELTQTGFDHLAASAMTSRR